MTTTDPVALFEAAASGAAATVGRVRPEQRDAATPCSEWDVEALLVHMTGGPAYLLTALGVETGPIGTDEASYRAAVHRCLEELARPDALEGRCASPAGFEWSIGEAVAGTFMDQLIHTWDLAAATGQDTRLPDDLVDACVAMFLPAMPEIGRGAGLVGPEVPVPPDASNQERLLGAMGRRP